MDVNNDSGKKATLSSRSVASLVSGVAKLIEGQKQFADEMGLPYARIFHDGFEAFKDESIHDVLFAWLHSGNQGHEKIENLFVDLLGHQLALVEALAEIKGQAREPASSLPKLLRLFHLDSPRSVGNPHASHKNYMEVTAPAFVAAYARSREHGRSGAPPFMDSHPANSTP